MAEEIVRADAPDRALVALDYFDAGLNRVGAWVAGARAALRALLFALLLPESRLREAEAGGRGLDRPVLREEARIRPAAYCRPLRARDQSAPRRRTRGVCLHPSFYGNIAA